MFLMSNRQNLSNWLQTELHSRNWTQSELARVSGLHRAIISKIVLQGSDPTPETLEAIAKALKLPPEQVYRVAGILPQAPDIAEEALALIPRALQKALQDVDPGGPLPSLPLPATAIADLERQKRRIQQAFESEIYTLEEADQKIKVINNEIKSHQSETDQRSRKQAERKRFTHTLAEARELLQHLPQWMANENPLVVNGVLTRLCQKITITPAGEIAIHFQQ